MEPLDTDFGEIRIEMQMPSVMKIYLEILPTQSVGNFVQDSICCVSGCACSNIEKSDCELCNGQNQLWWL